ncbi:MAG: hypothetical protein JWP69_477 [Flaviaesturariibacter sp.]|nr:hypothetical protein [Flaviaesturariibacter sp.]
MKKSITTPPPFRFWVLHFTFYILLASCSVQKAVQRSALKTMLDAPALQTAHIGISIYEPATGKYWYNHQGDKYFVPASNVKIPTCYAAMKYLGDSLVGLKYHKDDNGYILQGTGDPTFLHRDFKRQPVFDFLKTVSKSSDVNFTIKNWEEQHLGLGWSWNDFSEAYLAERSPFPIYGNIITLHLNKAQLLTIPNIVQKNIVLTPGIVSLDSIQIQRSFEENSWIVSPANSRFSRTNIPFKNSGYDPMLYLLDDTLKPRIEIKTLQRHFPKDYYTIHSQPTDSLLKPMMHRSDNFFAEQALLVVSNEKLGIMNDAKIIDTILKTDFKDLPQKPRWVDGSGLSRYNLFTPQDMVAILGKMQTEFGMNRIKTIFATGNEGTLSNYYKADSGYIYAKTGTLSGVVAISGFMETSSGKNLIFSVLVNNHQAPATEVRRAVEGFIQTIRKKY